jgi:hypothetical protein
VDKGLLTLIRRTPSLPWGRSEAILFPGTSTSNSCNVPPLPIRSMADTTEVTILQLLLRFRTIRPEVSYSWYRRRAMHATLIPQTDCPVLLRDRTLITTKHWMIPLPTRQHSHHRICTPPDRSWFRDCCISRESNGAVQVVMPRCNANPGQSVGICLIRKPMLCEDELTTRFIRGSWSH